MTITVLLGAGASCDAGIPMSLQMTSMLIDGLKGGDQQLIQFVYGGLLMQKAASLTAYPHRSAKVRIDVEDLFNAAEALGRRHGMDASPFVASWHPLLEQIGRAQPNPNALAQEFANALTGKFGGSPTRFAQAILDMTATRDEERRFTSLTNSMTESLEEFLKISDPTVVDYMRPILDLHLSQPGGLVIASLNYDVVVELAGQNAGIPVDDGMGAWNASGVVYPPDALRLMKLHGSITWSSDGRDDTIERHGILDTRPSHRRPAVIFGGRNKLRADGPFLELLWEWRSHLLTCDHLIVIGYSFRDDHINAIIDAWFKKDENRRVTIVDPGFDRATSPLSRTLYRWSNEILAPTSPPGPGHTSYPALATYAPVQLIRAGAASALKTLFDTIRTWPTTLSRVRAPFDPSMLVPSPRAV